MTFRPYQLDPFVLAGSGAIVGDTSITLKSMNDIDGSPVTMSQFGAIAYGTLEPGNSSMEEQISFTGITQNSNGTATITGVKSVTFVYPYTETSGLLKTHAGSTSLVASNTSGFYGQAGFKANNEVITGFWEAPDPLTNQGLATKKYVDDTVSGGSVTSAAVITPGTAGETVSAGQVLYLKAADGLWYKASSASAATTNLLQLGIAQGSGTISSAIVGGVLLKGYDQNQSGLTPGTIYYLSTGGAISSSAGTVERAIGQANAATILYFDPDFFYIPTATQKAAFAGTSGTPSTTNPFVTKSNLRFGGTGADGALAISSGTTTIDLANASIVVKNYTSISITGTGVLAFSNPNTKGTLIILKSQGSVTLSSSATPMIDCSALGAAAGAGGAVNNPGVDGTTASNFILDSTAHNGTGGAVANTAGTGGAILGTLLSYTQEVGTLNLRNIKIAPGSGGAGGAGHSAQSAGGAGGRGGGALYIECAGTFNFTTASGISVKGQNGTIGSAGGGGGGGGASGMAVILYNTAGTITGTIVDTGGTGGNGGSTATAGTAGGGGGGGGAYGGAGGAAGAGTSNTGGGGGGGGAGTSAAGSVGTAAGGGGTGGAGGAGLAGLVAINVYLL